MTAKKACWISLGLVAAAYLMDPINDPDLWWHLTAGRWIIAHQDVPQVEIWNRFSEGIPWKAYSWSNEVILAAVHNTFGLAGLFALKFALGLTLIFSLMYCYGRICSNMFLGAILGLLVLAGCDINFTLRPQCLAWALFAWMIYGAHKLSNKPSAVFPWLILILTSVIWANTHLTVVLGLAAVAFWTTRTPINSSTIGLPLTALATAFGATLLTPYFGKEWTTLFSKAHHPFAHSYIREFQPPTIYIYSVDILVLLLILFVAIWYRRPTSVPPTRLLGAVVFGIGGLTILKFTPFALIYLGFLLADLWQSRGKKNKQTNIEKGIAEGLGKLEAAPTKLFQIITLGCLLLTPVALYPSVKRPLSPSVPEKAVDFIIENNLPMPILNGFDDGGYLIFRFSNEHGEPENLVPIDGRTNVNNPKITDSFLKTLQGLPQWKEYLDIVEPKTIIWDTGFPLTAILDSHPSWCLVYPEKRENLSRSSRAIFVKEDLCEMVRDNAYHLKPEQSFLQAPTEDEMSEADKTVPVVTAE